MDAGAADLMFLVVLAVVAFAAFLLGIVVVRTLWPPSRIVVVYTPPVTEGNEQASGCAPVFIALGVIVLVAAIALWLFM